MCQLYHLALGGNLPSEVGPPVRTLAKAIPALLGPEVQLRAVSRFFATPCFPAGAGPDYVNAALSLKSKLPPREMLAHLHSVEARFGRERVQRWGMRTLDIDLLSAGAQVLPDPQKHAHWRKLSFERQRSDSPDDLILPHPRLQERAFVLVPLNDIAPGWSHPILGQTVREMLQSLPESERNEVVPL